MANESHRPRDWRLVRKGTVVVAWLVKERLKVADPRARVAHVRAPSAQARGNIGTSHNNALHAIERPPPGRIGSIGRGRTRISASNYLMPCCQGLCDMDG